MAEGLARKKRIQAGRKASTTKLLNKLDELWADSDSVDTSKLEIEVEPGGEAWHFKDTGRRDIGSHEGGRTR